MKKSILTIHKEVAREQFNQLKFEGKDKKLARRIYVATYLHNKTRRST